MAARSPKGGVDGSPLKARSVSPASRIPAEAQGSETYRTALRTLSEAAWKFNRERDGSFLKEIDNREIDKELFRIQIRGGLNCRLSPDELNSLLPHFDNNGFVDGCEFILLLYRLRFEFRSKILTQKIAKEKEFLAKEKEWVEKRRAEAEAKSSVTKVSFDFTEADYQSAMEIVTEAAFRYDRAMPGTVQLEAFECEYLDAATFKEQLRRVFNMRLSPAQYGAFLSRSPSFYSSDNGGLIFCSEFLVFFLRLGFNQRASLVKRQREEKLRINAEREEKMAEEKAALANKNALKMSLHFFPEDKDRVLLKLRDAAKAYDKNTPGAMSMQSFEVQSMPPHVFKEQLKRVFNLHVTPRELGALMSVFDEQGTGVVVCSDFSKTFLAMGFAEREKAFKANLEKQREADRQRILDEEAKLKALAGKNVLDLSVVAFTKDDLDSAMQKLNEAAFRFDKSMPGSPNLTAFEMKEMEPVIFKEQLRRAFNVRLSSGELAALVDFFDTHKTGKVPCKEFLIIFLKKGFDERSAKEAAYRQQSRETEERMKKEEEEKKEHADRKGEIALGSYSDAEYNSALEKLTLASFKYHKDPSSSAGLDAFESDHLAPHVFKEQIRMCFGVKATPGELAALVDYFADVASKEKHGGGAGGLVDRGVVRCKSFLNEFFRIGHEERDKVAAGWRREQRAAEERVQQEEQEREAEKAAKQQREVDFNFGEADFDAALTKFLHMCHGFEQRQLGPAGLSAFTCAYLTPSEFRETFKRTFGVRVGPRELGALVRYMEVPGTPGNVNCTAFLNLFVQLRVHCEGIKGKTAAAGPQGPALEARLLKEYHAELKEAYRAKVERLAALAEAGAGRGLDKPWLSDAARRAAASSSSSSVSGPGGRRKKAIVGPAPRTPADKLKLRLTIARLTGKLDLSTKAKWKQGEGGSEALLLPTPAQAHGLGSAKGGGKLSDKQRRAIKAAHLAHAASSVDDAALVELGLPEVLPRTDFRLAALPDETFKLADRLTQLWLDNHDLGWLPSSLGDLVLLEVLSVAGNALEELPPALCKLTSLRRLLARRNKLKFLPEGFEALQLLVEVDLAHNSLPRFPKALCALPSLQHLLLNKNDIAEVPEELKQLRSLSYLDLDGCPIKRPPACLGKMYWLDVVGCPLPTAPLSAFRFAMTAEDEEEIDSFLRHRAAARKAASAASPTKGPRKTKTTATAATTTSH